MATNQQIAQAFQSLRTAFSSEVRPRILAVGRQVGDGALWSEVETEIASIRAELDSLYGRIQQFLSDARSNDPQDPDLIAQLETSLNTNRANNFKALAELEELARGSEQQQLEREAEGQEDIAASDAGPGTVSAGDVVSESAEARDTSVSNPSESETGLDVDQSTNAVPAAAVIVEKFPAVPTIPGGTTPFQNAAQNSQGGRLGAGSTPVSQAAFAQSTPQKVTQSLVYRVVQVTSRFSRGEFTQDLEGVILNFGDELTSTGTSDERLAEGTTEVNQRQIQTDPGEVPGVTVSDRGQTDPGEIPGVTVRAYNTPIPSTPIDTSGGYASLDDLGGFGPGSSQPTTDSDGQNISLGTPGTDASSDAGTESGPTQIIARDD